MTWPANDLMLRVWAFSVSLGRQLEVYTIIQEFYVSGHCRHGGYEQNKDVCSKTCLATVLIRSIFAREKLHERFSASAVFSAQNRTN